MSDRDDLVALTIRYATAIDTEQYSLLTKVFTNDAQVDYGDRIVITEVGQTWSLPTHFQE